MVEYTAVSSKLVLLQEVKYQLCRSLYDIGISLFLIPIGKKEFKRNERKFNEV
jgi:hypothetical protein